MTIKYRGVQEVADELGVDVQTVRRWIHAGRLRAFKPGKEYRIQERDLEEFLRAREVRPKVARRSSLEPSFNDVLDDERRTAILSEVRAAVLEELQKEERAITRALESGEPQSRHPRYDEIARRLAEEHPAEDLATLLVVLMKTESASEPISTLRRRVDEAYHGTPEHRRGEVNQGERAR